MSDGRWPFSFSMDDLDITGCVLADAPQQLMDEPNPSWRTDPNAQRAGDRVPGVWVTHIPTGKQVISTMLATREQNLTMALRRLDGIVRRAQG